MMKIGERLTFKYSRYDRLSEWETQHEEIYFLFMKLVRFYNAGNTAKILKNTTAYFQTEIPH